ncbi:hypothetical protein EC973_004557 [Apophysomyces ossiformis]|uniref:Uncharacterized protein n=1 Tax=Apophysomyces ossiformis TaxID=679940 RepID=A0A8H7ER99_9FUNG|nr:hypothetical protein EC973_004557 [Apophysomyces ossiformis]
MSDEIATTQDWASQMNDADRIPHFSAWIFEHHDALPDFIQKLLDELNDQKRRLDRHYQLYDEIKRLQELSAANERVAELEDINADSCKQLPIGQGPQGTLASIHAPPPN